MKRLLLSVAFAALVAAVGLAGNAYGSDFAFWLLLWPFPVFIELLPPAADGGFFRISAVTLSLLTSTTLYALAAYLFLFRPRPRRLP